MRRYRYWPRWLCWLFGHEPVTPVDDYSRDNVRCLCGTEVVTGMEHFFRVFRPSQVVWSRFIGRAWRFLP